MKYAMIAGALFCFQLKIIAQWNIVPNTVQIDVYDISFL